MTLAEALRIALDAYNEDEAERERILELLAPILFGRSDLLRAAIDKAWRAWPADMRRSEAALTEYQAERARIDSETLVDPLRPLSGKI